jgi:hypothetical protein
MKLRQCGKTWESEENGHFSLNNGEIVLEFEILQFPMKNKVWFVYKYPKMLSFTVQVKISKNTRWYIVH